MDTQSFHFRVGAFECIVVNDGSLAYSNPAQVHFANAPADHLALALAAYGLQIDQWAEWISPLLCLVIRTGEHQVLVDTGLGSVDFAPNAGRLLQNLQAEGIAPGDIDTVILTHAHGDHIGGNTDPEGQPAFPRARYKMWKAEWDFWTSEATLAQPEYQWMSSFVHSKLLPIHDRFEFLQQDIEIVPGVSALFAPGHTPGHMALVVASDGEQLLCLGDAIAHPIHVERLDWHCAPDCQPEQALRSRQQLLERAAADRALTFAFHLDFPGLGYVHPHGEGLKWRPYAI